MREILLIAHDMRSCHNVGSLLRTAEGLGVSKVFLTGYTPYPTTNDDTRLPHIAQKLTKQIHKAALGAETTQAWEQADDVYSVLGKLKSEGYTIVGLEQSQTAIPLPEFKPTNKIALLLGREVEGIDAALLTHVDTVVEIPMFGNKESFNVVQAAAMSLYHLRFTH